MGEISIDEKVPKDAIREAPQSPSPNPAMASSNPRVEFYDKYRRETDEHDRDFTKKYDDDLSNTLIFAGLFSAVATGFVVDLQKRLEPDYQEMGYTVLEIIANRLNNQTAPPLPQWNGPDPTNVHVLAILYTSLAISLLAAFIAILGKQWLNRYGRAEIHGSAMDRTRDRQRKINGMVTWRFSLVMESLPLMLQAALLLLGYAIFNYILPINKIVAYVTISFTALGFLFYTLIVAAAIFSYNCPFQTPISLFVHLLLGSSKKAKKKSGGRFGRISSREKKRPGGPHVPNQPGASDGNGAGSHTTIPITSGLPSFFGNEGEVGDYVLDSKCIAWMFEKSTDADVIIAIMRFIPEVDWHPDIRTTPLKTLYDTVLECFDRSSGHPVVFPKLKNKAYLSAKALLHLAIQRKCINDPSDGDVFNSISDRYQIMGSEHCEGDADLESTLRIIDRIFAGGKTSNIPWQGFLFTDSHHAWMGHVLLCRAWGASKGDGLLPDDVTGFVLCSLQSNPPPPTTVVIDCLSIISLVLKIDPHVDDAPVTDMSSKADLQINEIYEKLTKTFNNLTSKDEIDGALEAMKLIAPLSNNNVAQKSYNLFHLVMQALTSATYTQENKWEAARLTMHGAYKSDKFLPPVGDPKDILAFLTHQFDAAAGGRQYQDEPIQDALRALAHASIESLEHFDPTQPRSFVDGIRYVYENKQLRKAAFFFLRLISDKWFDTPDPIMKADEMKRFCADWASTMDEIGDTDDVKKVGLVVLFGMVNSLHWRPHIVTKKWELLESFALIPDDSPSFRKCISNPDLMDAIKETGNVAATALWLKILWLKFGKIIPAVQDRLMVFTKEFAQSGNMDLYKCQVAVDLELETAEKELTLYASFSKDPTAVALRTKVENLELARDTLASIKKGQPLSPRDGTGG